MATRTTLRGNRNRRRPPKNPAAAALRPRNAMEQAAMNSFRHKVATASTSTICNSTSPQVGKISMHQLLQSKYPFCVPIFQRKYCWTQVQWQTLLDDAMAQIEGQQLPHSLGRLTCTNIDKTTNSSQPKKLWLAGIPGRSCILDGQQRLTTVTILLATIRDLLQQDIDSNHLDERQQNQCRKAILSINDLLFVNPIRLRTWMIQHPDWNLAEGEELPFVRLIPTFCDRWSYYHAILPSNPNDNKVLSCTSADWNRPLHAKQYFVQAIPASAKSQWENVSTRANFLLSLLRAVLNGFTMLLFPVDLDNGYTEDGTEDLMVIYERLAIRDATLCKPSRDEEYLSMDGSDMIRNLLLGSFRDLPDAVSFYKESWLPLERLTSQESFGHTLKDVLSAFLDHQPTKTNSSDLGIESDETPAGIIGGKLYAKFQIWFQGHIDNGHSTVLSDQDPASTEIRVREAGDKLLHFARTMSPQI